MLCCNHTCYCVNMISVTSASRYITSASRYHPRYQSRSSMYIRSLIPRNFAELAEAVPIGSVTYLFLHHTPTQVRLTWKLKRDTKQEIVFMKHYAPTSSLSLRRISTPSLSPGNIHSNLYQLTKYEATSCNSFRDVFITNF